jgi:three-Cys-motif partner protein
MKKPIDPKKTMLAHSEAKVEFFKKYLERYLRILYLAPSVEAINVFDVFCGTGIYDNDKKGSPIVAFDAIKSLRETYDYTKKINLVVNDSKETKVSSVQNYINSNNKNYCNVNYQNQTAELMFKEVVNSINTQNAKSRNLIFIDPYGYKEIKKTTLLSLLQNNRTEIILFLPISQMQRFTVAAIESELKPYEPLKEFVYSFFNEDHPIRKQTVSAIDYLNYVKEALRFNNYYSASYYIERDERNYYGLFFISPHIYALEKILEVKWQLDEDDGKGFKQPEMQSSLFSLQDKELKKNDNYARLEKILKDSLKTPKNNQELYKIILEHEFLPKHAAEVFRNWQKDLSNFSVTEILTNKPARKNSFYITWEWFNPAVHSKPKVKFELK